MNRKTGIILKKAIKEAGYRQKDFAVETGVGFSTLKKYISGNLSYSVETLERFAEILNCSYDYLMGKSPVPHKGMEELTREYLDLSLEYLNLSLDYVKFAPPKKIDESRKAEVEKMLMDLRQQIGSDEGTEGIGDRSKRDFF